MHIVYKYYVKLYAALLQLMNSTSYKNIMTSIIKPEQWHSVYTNERVSHIVTILL